MVIPMFFLIWGFASLCYIKVASVIIFGSGINLISSVVLSIVGLGFMFAGSGVLTGLRARWAVRKNIHGAQEPMPGWAMAGAVFALGLAYAALSSVLLIGFDHGFISEVWRMKLRGLGVDRSSDALSFFVFMSAPVWVHGGINVFLLTRS